MKRLSLYLFLLLFTLQTPSWADDIRDFQIEGMSIGDSLLDYFSEEVIKKNKVNYYNSEEFVPVYIEDSSKFNNYNGVQFHYKKNDKNFKKTTAIKELWKAALFIESGQLVKAEEDLRRAQENLKKALTESGDATKIQENIDNLDEALEKYLDEVEDPINIDAPQVSVSDDPGDRGGESGA